MREQEGMRTLSHPAFQSIKVETCESLSAEGRVTSSLQTVLTCTNLISPQTISQVITFLYTGRLDNINNITALTQVSLSSLSTSPGPVQVQLSLWG